MYVLYSLPTKVKRSIFVLSSSYSNVYLADRQRLLYAIEELLPCLRVHREHLERRLRRRVQVVRARFEHANKRLRAARLCNLRSAIGREREVLDRACGRLLRRRVAQGQQPNERLYRARLQHRLATPHIESNRA